MHRGEAMDTSSVSGYMLSTVYGVFGVVQMAAQDVTGYGMLLIAAFSAWSTHASRQQKKHYEARETAMRADFDDRETKLISRIEMLIRQLPCEHVECPVIATIKREGTR